MSRSNITILILLLCLFVGCNQYPPEKQEFSDFVDLNLPSGTLWKNANEGENTYYTYYEAVALYVNYVPTWEQYEELMQYCKWEWHDGGYKVIGSNNKEIWLPAGGRICPDVDDKTTLYGCYWSTTPYPDENHPGLISNLFFNKDAIMRDGSPAEYGHFLRLVRQEKSKTYSGDIVGLVGCYDERDDRSSDPLRAGVVILTNEGDSLLSFIMKLDENIHPLYGKYQTYSISPIPVPYEFYYRIIDSTDERFVRIADIIEDAEHLPCQLPNVQVDIIPIE